MFLNRLTHSIVQMLLSDARLCSQRMSGRVLSIFLYFSHIIDYTPKKGWFRDFVTLVLGLIMLTFLVEQQYTVVLIFI